MNTYLGNRNRPSVRDKSEPCETGYVALASTGGNFAPVYPEARHHPRPAVRVQQGDLEGRQPGGVEHQQVHGPVVARPGRPCVARPQPRTRDRGVVLHIST